MAENASEFGGVSGPIQPPPHELTPAELAKLQRKVRPDDKDDTIEAARIREGGAPSA